MDIPDDPYRVAPPGTLSEDFAEDYDAEADDADSLNDMEWCAERCHE